MKAKWIISGFAVFTALAIAAGVWIAQSAQRPVRPANPEQKFQAQGIVLSLQPGSKTVVIEHQDIPQFMPAMTMPFVVKDETLLRGLKPMDHVRFELTVTKTDSWVSKISRLPGSASSNATVEEEESPQLKIGQVVPDFALRNQDGHSFRLSDFRGEAVLLTFIYTRCPLPNYCPLMSKNFAELQKRLGRKFHGHFHLITISFDPEYDTPQVLKGYAQIFTKDETTWTFATGTKQQIHDVATEFGLIYLPQIGSFTHDLRTALIAPNGQLIHVWRSNYWSVDDVQRRVAEVLQWDPGALVSSGPRAAAHSSRQYSE